MTLLRPPRASLSSSPTVVVSRRQGEAPFGATEQLHRVVLDAVHALHRRPIDPRVVDDPVLVRMHPGQDDGVTRGGLGHGVAVTAVGEVCAVFEQQSESTRHEVLAKPGQIVAAKLIDRDDHHERWRDQHRVGGGGRTDQAGHGQEETDESEKNPGRAISKDHREGGRRIR